MNDGQRLQILDATEEHAETIAEFNAAMALETEDLRLDFPRLLSGVRAVFDNPQRGFYLVAVCRGETAGCLMVTTEWSDWRNGDFWWIQSVYVAPAFRRRSVFRAMHREVLARAREQGGVCGVRLYVERDNLRAQSTYRSLGMRDAGYLVFDQTL